MNRVADVINSGFRNTLSKKGMDILTQGLHLKGISLSFFPYFTYFLFLLIFIFIVLFFFLPFSEDWIRYTCTYQQRNESTYKCLLTLLFMEVDKVRINGEQ